MAFDQDAVDEAVRILQPQIDDLKARPAGMNSVKLVLTFEDGTEAVYLLQPPVA